jgi:DNA repair ATPase RecN
MIQKLSIRNFLGIKQVEITPDNKLNVITGGNGSGKTSILRAIETAFSGRIGKDIKIIHIGEDKAEILVELDDIIINKSFTKNGTTTKITKDGCTINKPQEYLDGIIGDFSFNPIEFANMKEEKKTEYLLKLLNIKFNQSELEDMLHIKIDREFKTIGLELLENVHDYYYDKRKNVNLQRTTLEKYINESLDKLGSVTFNADQYNKAIEEKNYLIQKRQDVAIAKTEYTKKQQDLDRINNDIEELQKKLLQLTKESKQLTDELSAYKEDTYDYDQEIKKLDDVLNILIEQKSKYDQKIAIEKESEKLHYLTKEHLMLDDIVKKCSTQIKDDIMAKSKLPIDGLSFIDGHFLINGKNFDNLSGRERLFISLDIAKALNNNFKIICIDGAECLDKESFELLKQEIMKDEYQFFITNVHSEGNINVNNGMIQ